MTFISNVSARFPRLMANECVINGIFIFKQLYHGTQNNRLETIVCRVLHNVNYATYYVLCRTDWSQDQDPYNSDMDVFARAYCDVI